MNKDDAGRDVSGCISSSAAAAPEGVLRRRRLEQKSAVENAPAGRLLDKGATSRPDGAKRRNSDAKEHDTPAVSVARRSRSTSEDAAATSPATSDGVVTEPAGNRADTAAIDRGKAHEAEHKDGSITASTHQQPGGSRLLIEVTPRIRTFLETRVAPKARKELMISDRIDLDVLQRLVTI